MADGAFVGDEVFMLWVELCLLFDFGFPEWVSCGVGHHG